MQKKTSELYGKQKTLWQGVSELTVFRSAKLPLALQRLPTLSRSGLLEHGFPLLIYFALSIGLTWPLVRDFSSRLIGFGDAQHNLWVLWHAREAFQGNESMFWSQYLYYPEGITMLTNALGPVIVGLFALPFWSLGPEAAHNGAVLVGFWLTGYAMYLLARGLKFRRDVAILAGIIYLAAPIHLSAVYSHMTKIFLGALPLILLTFHYAVDVKRSRWWSLGVGVSMLLALLHSGEQFVYGGLSIVFFALFYLVTTGHESRWLYIKRLLLIATVTVIFCAPLLFAILHVSNDLDIAVGRNQESFSHQPDLALFFLPVPFGRLGGQALQEFVWPYVKAEIEVAVFLSWTALLLASLAVVRSIRRQALPWLSFTLCCIVFALGPKLLVLGHDQFTEYNLPIVMPYAFLTALPGLDFMRTPGRFMLIGYIGLAIVVAYGMTWLQQRVPYRVRGGLSFVAVVLILLEFWPKPWPQETLRPVPEFYQEIAQDGEMYGVFDLPIRPDRDQQYDSWHIFYSSRYQTYQLTHGKGIATGYVSRYYTVHPTFGHIVSDSVNDSPYTQNILVNGEPANRYANFEYELAINGFRYVVFHKPQPAYSQYKPGSWGEQTAKTLLQHVFGDRQPIVDDELVTVYKVEPAPDVGDLTTTIALRENPLQTWIEYSQGKRVVHSPSTFYVVSPQTTPAWLSVTPEYINNRVQGKLLDKAMLTVQSANGLPATVELQPGQTAKVPILLAAGSQVITMTLDYAGNTEQGDVETGLEFAIQSIDLTVPDETYTP